MSLRRCEITNSSLAASTALSLLVAMLHIYFPNLDMYPKWEHPNFGGILSISKKKGDQLRQSGLRCRAKIFTLLYILADAASPLRGRA